MFSFSATGPSIPLEMISLPLLRILGDDGGTESEGVCGLRYVKVRLNSYILTSDKA